MFTEFRRHGIPALEFYNNLWGPIGTAPSGTEFSGPPAYVVGCSDFGFFHILRYNNPFLTPLGPKDLEFGRKKLLTSSMACKNFWQKPENVFFWYSFKV
jgi:hypothetical protein